MDKIVMLPFEGDEIRMLLDRENNPWFVAADLGRVLGFKNIRSSLMGLDADCKGKQILDTIQGQQTLTTVNEAGMYTLVIRSSRPKAALFRRWVTGEVLPQLRTTGTYTINQAVEETPKVFHDIKTIVDIFIEHKEQGARLNLAPMPKILMALNAVKQKTGICMLENTNLKIEDLEQAEHRVFPTTTQLTLVSSDQTVETAYRKEEWLYLGLNKLKRNCRSIWSH